VVTVAAVFGDDPLGFLAVPILVVGLVLVLGTLLVLAVIFQGLRDFRNKPDELL
jgi:hypothetical protein